MNKFGLVIGEPCRPPFLGLTNMILTLDLERDVKFYWHQTYSDYWDECVSVGLSYVSASWLYDWIQV